MEIVKFLFEKFGWLIYLYVGFSIIVGALALGFIIKVFIDISKF